MALSIVEIAAAREQLQPCWTSRLAAHLLEFEPDDTIECEIDADDQWETVSLPVSKERLLASTGQASPRRALIEELRAPLSRASGARNVDSRVYERTENRCYSLTSMMQDWNVVASVRSDAHRPGELGEHHPLRARLRTTKK